MAIEYSKIPRSEVNSRITRLKTQLLERDLHGALLLSAPELYYYSGLGSEGAVYIPVEGEPIHRIRRNLELARLYSQIQNVQFYHGVSNLMESLKIGSGTRIAIEGDLLPYSLVSFLRSQQPGIELVDGSSVFRQLRSIKSRFEISQIKEAAALVDRSFDYCAETVTTDMTEIELTSKLDGWLLENGHSGFISSRAFNLPQVNFSYVISSGSSTLNIFFTSISGRGLSLKYPYGPSRQKIGENRPFFADICGNHNGYISDTTRTFVCGRFDSTTRNQLDALIQIKDFLKRRLRPGVNLGVLYEKTLDLSKELKIADNFLGTISDKVAFLGHGVGLELDELPLFSPKGPDLIRGNVLACEPKFIIKDIKVLGIEDVYVITQIGNTILSQAPNFFEI